MGPESLNGYSYKHHGQKAPQAIDVHEIYARRSRLRVLLSYVGMLSLLASVYCSLMWKTSKLQENLSVTSIWSILVGVLVAKCLEYRPVKKESVVIMPAFGVQLETHFWSGRVYRRFVPIGKILRPVLNECVTPVTCYWSLALILRDEDELMLVFMKLHPPVKLLVPVWKALCAASDYEDFSSSIDPPLN